MFSTSRSTRWVLAASLCLVTGAAVWTNSALADSKETRSDEQRINDRMTKDADDHLKNNLADEGRRESLKKEIVRAEAVRRMAETLAADPKFVQAYTTLLKNNEKRRKDVMPSDKDVLKEKESIIKDDDAMQRVMARALDILQAKDEAHK